MAAGGTTATKEHGHPKERAYVIVALWLALITGAEISISYIKMPDPAKIVALVVLSAIKFAAVVAYFMHLKFDNPALRKPFITGIILACTLYTIVLLAFTLHS
ncbi:MAG TPA: cytochrome C oxidase subunit IV family protein, partial [Actinomycetota bacterium]|nr:cytochrome C oxidase subunit IV family protein [Actinomycetota bacterium]